VDRYLAENKVAVHDHGAAARTREFTDSG